MKYQNSGSNKEDKITIAQAEDKINQCQLRGYITWTNFLDSHQQSLLRQTFGKNNLGCNIEFFGGYDDAQRVIMVCIPNHMFFEKNDPLRLLKVQKINKRGRELAHSDYLGSILSLGIKREMIGDILVEENGGNIIVLQDIVDFILNNYSKVGREEIYVEASPISEISFVEEKKEEIKTTVASLRLDNIIASGFNISRKKAVDAIKSGLVFVNHIETPKVDAILKEGDLISFRRKGRLKLLKIGGSSRKNRIYIILEK